MKIYILLLLLLTNLEQSKSTLLRGKRAQDGQFPWLIQFQTVAPCGGVLISSDWVLTAAQCVQDKRNSIDLFAMGLNGTDTKQTISVKATYIHPHYEPYSVLPDRDYNIALMKLTKPFDMCNSKVVLPNISIKYNNNYAPCLIFGWQSYISPSSKVFAKPIQYSEVVLNSWKLCTYMIKASANYTNVFCAMVEFKDEMKACAGNPGSPVVCENQQRETALIGIASWTNFSLECGDLPTYLDLDTFRIWINNLIVNGKEIEKWEDKDRLNEEGCKFKGNISCWPENIKTRSQNESAVVISYHETATERKNLSYIWNRLHIPIFYKFNHKNISSSSSDYMSYADIAKEAIIYNYEEIGKATNSLNNKIIKNPNKDQLSSSNKSILCNYKKIDKLMTEHNQDQSKIDHFEFLLPFNFEDINASYSRITVAYSRNLHLFYFIFLYVYVIIYI